MKWNWIINTLAVFAAILIGIWIAIQNKKDKRSLIRELDNDYLVPKENEPKS